MVKIRLRRVGATKRPSYRIVAADSRSPRDGRFLEILGHYNPLTEPATVVVKEDRVRYWVEHGAQPSDVVARLLSQRGFLGAATTVAEPEVSVQEIAPAPEAVVAEPEVSVQEIAPAPEALEAVSPTAEEAAVETERPRRTVRRRATAEEPAVGAETPRRTTRRRTTAEQPEGQGAEDAAAKQESGDGA